MKYHNTIITCKKENFEELQKYLFRIGYYYIVKSSKDRNIQLPRTDGYYFNNDFDCCVIIKNDRSIWYRNVNCKIFYSFYQDFKILRYPNCVRLDKLKKLNNWFNKLKR